MSKELRCGHCKRPNLRREPACRVCMICGWVKYCDGGDPRRLFRQAYINSQYMSNTHKIQLNSIYRVTNEPARPLTEEEQGGLEPTQKICRDAVIGNDKKKFRSFSQREGLDAA